MIDLKLLRGATLLTPTSPTSAAYTGPIGEVLVDTDGFGHGGPLLRIQDGITAGGWLIGGTAGSVNILFGSGTMSSPSPVTNIATVGLSLPLALIGAQYVTIDTFLTGIAAAGTNLGGATVLTHQQNYVSSGVNGTAGVSIGTALMSAGGHVYVFNEDGTNNLLVYPPSGGTINNQGSSVPMTLFFNSGLVLLVKSSSALRSVP